MENPFEDGFDLSHRPVILDMFLKILLQRTRNFRIGKPFWNRAEYVEIYSVVNLFSCSRTRRTHVQKTTYTSVSNGQSLEKILHYRAKTYFLICLIRVFRVIIYTILPGLTFNVSICFVKLIYPIRFNLTR